MTARSRAVSLEALRRHPTWSVMHNCVPVTATTEGALSLRENSEPDSALCFVRLRMVAELLVTTSGSRHSS